MALDGIRSSRVQDAVPGMGGRTAVSAQGAVEAGLLKNDFSSVLEETLQSASSALGDLSASLEPASASSGIQMPVSMTIPFSVAASGQRDSVAVQGSDAAGLQPTAESVGVPLAVASSPISWISETAITPTPGTSLVDAPGSLSATGNTDSDGLVDRVMALRQQRGLSSDPASRAIAEAQTCLISLGYGVGGFGPFGNGVDGILGPVTSAGLSSFQQEQGLSVTGTLTAETADRLKELGKPALDRISDAWRTELGKSPYAADAFQGTANPFWYVRFVAGAGDTPETMGNIDPVFKGRLAALARDMGQTADFGEGFRDLARQQEFYDRYLAGTGALAARPGMSKHNMGLAVDTQSGWLQSLNDGIAVERQTALLQYGLCKPMADDAGQGHEAWHIQPLESLNV